MGEQIWKNSDFNGKKVDDKEIKDENDENNSLKSTGETRLEEYSADKISVNDLEPLADNWRDEIRTQIATVVRHAALQERLE